MDEIRTSDGIFPKEKPEETKDDTPLPDQDKNLARILGQAKSRIESRRNERMSSSDEELSGRAGNQSVQDLLPIEESEELVSGKIPPATPEKIAPSLPPVNLPSESLDIKPSQPGVAQMFDDLDRIETEPDKKDNLVPKKTTPEEILGIPDKRNTDIESESDADIEMAPEKSSPAIESIIKRSKAEARESLEEEFDASEKKGGTGSKLKLAFISIGAAMLLVGAAGFVFTNFLGQDDGDSDDQVIDDDTDDTVFVPAPDPILIVDAIEEVEIGSMSNSEFRSRADEIARSAYPAQSTVYLPVMLKAGQTRRHITLSEFFQLMEASTPAALTDYEKYSAFMYFPTANSETDCFAANILDSSCYGPRLGIVIDISSRPGSTIGEETSQVLSSMASWEPTMIRDLDSMILAPLPSPVPPSFSTGNYNGLTTRYVTLPIPTTSLDWMLYDNYLIISTSMESARAAQANLDFSFDEFDDEFEDEDDF